mmetsp:Transcript_59617/g.134288  ORF Transcript_59617/g.134288 Transcript_59617/m.134288 type:complete len:168 (+) Transcript_59617:84-587(+)
MGEGLGAILVIIAGFDIGFGAFHLFFRGRGRTDFDKDCVFGLVFGTLVILFGHTLLIGKSLLEKPPLAVILLGKVVIAFISLVFGLMLLDEETAAMSVSLILYALTTLPVIAAIHQKSRVGGVRNLPGAYRMDSAPLSHPEWRQPQFAPPPGGAFPPQSGGPPPYQY